MQAMLQAEKMYGQQPDKKIKRLRREKHMEAFKDPGYRNRTSQLLTPIWLKWGSVPILEAYLLTYLFTRPTRHPSDLKDRFGLSRRVIDLDMWVGSCIPYVQTGGVGGGLG